jgi:hypothetical protein
VAGLSRQERQRFRIGAVGILHLAAGLQYSERNRLRRMVNNHADMLLPGSGESRFTQARRSASSAPLISLPIQLPPVNSDRNPCACLSFPRVPAVSLLWRKV